MMTKPDHVYVCSAGHVDTVPSMGMYLSCQVPQLVVSRRGGTGYAPCGALIVSVPDPDGALEAAFRVGGPEAAKLVIVERAREGASPAPAGR